MAIISRKLTSKPNTGPSHLAKLTVGEALFVRSTAKRVPARELARHFGVSVATIFNVRRGVIYRDMAIKRSDLVRFLALCNRFNVSVEPRLT